MFNSNNVDNNINEVKGESKEFADKLKNSALETGQAIKEQIKTSGKEALDKSAGFKEQMVDWIKDNPMKSVGVAFLAGWFMSKKKCPVTKE